MLIRADARHIPLKADTVQCVVTSPPYWGLRDYGLGENGIGLEHTPEEYVAQIVAVFREVWRVLRDDGTVWLNLGDSYTSGNRPDRDHSLVSLSSGLTNRSAGMDRAKTPDGLKPKDLVGVPWRVAFALQADGWYLRSDIIWAKPNPMPESVRDRPTKAHEYIFLLTKSERYYFDQEAVKEIATNERSWNKTPDTRVPGQTPNNLHKIEASPNRNIRSVWTIATQPYSGAHFATFPREIPKRCIKAGTKPGDVVLDPFCGSGTTVMVARDLRRFGIGLDLKYQDLSAERVAGPLFAAVVNSAW